MERASPIAFSGQQGVWRSYRPENELASLMMARLPPTTIPWDEWWMREGKCDAPWDRELKLVPAWHAKHEADLSLK